MRLITAALLLLLASSVPARAKEREKRDAMEDPYILQELKNAEVSNLDNALEQSRKRAARAAEYLRGLMAAAKSQSDSLLADIAAAGEGEKADARMETDLEELALSSQMMPLKFAQFMDAAKKAQVPLPKAALQELLGAGSSYRSGDRQRDLRRAEDYVKQAMKRLKVDEPPPLGEDQARLLKAAQDFQGELDHFRTLAKKARGRIETSGLGKGALANKMDFWIKNLDKSGKDVSNECRVLEAELTLARSDEEDF